MEHNTTKMGPIIQHNVYKVNDKWFIKSKDGYVNFPPLHYFMVESLDEPQEKKLVLGGSHTAFVQLPMYFTRREIFEENFMPYQIKDSNNFKIRNAVLLWPRLNLYSYTDLSDPQSVYIKKGYKFVAKFTFSTERICLYEVVH